MPSTDVDGGIIVILSKEEAEAFYRLLKCQLDCYHDLAGAERRAADKLARDLNLPPLE